MVFCTTKRQCNTLYYEKSIFLSPLGNHINFTPFLKNGYVTVTNKKLQGTLDLGTKKPQKSHQTMRREFNRRSGAKPKSTLRKIFDTAVTGAILAAGVYYAGDVADFIIQKSDTVRLGMIENRIAADPQEACLRASTLRPPGYKKGMEFKPSDKQRLLTALFNKMSETQIGQTLNRSAAENDLIWCVNNIEQDNYGYYNAVPNMATLSANNFGSTQVILSNKTLFERAVRTVYEENTHAWQNNEHDAQNGRSLLTGPMHEMIYNLSVEADARVVTVAALDQHRQQGDKSLWDTNYRHSMNTSMMSAYDNALRGKNRTDAYPQALRAVFDSFFKTDGNGRVYQYDIHPEEQWADRKLSPADFEKSFGFVPGYQGNYLKKTGFSPDDTQFQQIHSPDLMMRMVKKYIDMGKDPSTLAQTSALSIKNYEQIRIEGNNMMQSIKGLNKNGKWVTVSTNYTIHDVNSPFYIDPDALKKGWLLITETDYRGEQSLVMLQKLSDLTQKIEDIRPAETIPDYDRGKDNYIHFEDLIRLQKMHPTMIERIAANLSR